MLSLDYLRHHLIIISQSLFQCLLNLNHAHHTLSIRILAPGNHGFALQVVLDKSEEVGELAFGIFVEVVLSSN
jgi:hypothetical protein